MKPQRILIVLVTGALALPPAAAQETPEHRHPPGDAHGTVDFPVTCLPEVHRPFAAAVAILHSFGYEEPRRDFEAVARRDPACGMAWWGIAMTYFHQHWDQPTPAELAGGRSAAERAVRLGGGSARERAYIAAIAAFYEGADRRDHRTRLLAYRAAMERLAADFPDDVEARVFYALALLATRDPGDTTHATQREAARILDALLPEHAEHPGIVHYTIHAFDYPQLAALGLRAARVYARIAPASPHAQHMPSHIFTRLGLWEESIRSNLAVARVAQAQVARTDPGAVAYEHLHALDYLEYAYLQLGDDEQARRVMDEVAAARRLDAPTFSAAYALVSVPARYAVERRDWEAAAALRLPALELPWANFLYARGNTHYANAIGAARLGDAERVRAAVAELTQLHADLAAAPPRGAYDWAGRVNAMRLAATGLLAAADGRSEEGVRALREAAALEDRVGKHPVTPGAILPAWELLGDLLLELDRPADALAAYEAALAGSPRRLNSLAGAGRAAELAGARDTANTYYRELLELCRPGTCRRPAARHAAAFLSAAREPSGTRPR
jgi:hypothetical protein